MKISLKELEILIDNKLKPIKNDLNIMKDDIHDLIPSFIEIDKKLEHLDTLSYKIQVKIEDIF